MADKLFVKFIEAYHNYNMYGANDDLLKIVIKIYNNTMLMEYEDANEQYDEYMKSIIERDIYSFNDLVDPVNKIYYDYIKPNL